MRLVITHISALICNFSNVEYIGMNGRVYSIQGCTMTKDENEGAIRTKEDTKLGSKGGKNLFC